MRRKKKIIIAILSIPLIIILGIAGMAGFLFWGIHRSIAQLDAVPLSPANYQPAAWELVKLYQSDPSFYDEKANQYLDFPNPVWAPPSVAKLDPEMIDIASDHANVYWGGGFYHCGWKLVRGPASRNGSSYSWTLSFFSEDGPDKTLETMTVGADQHFTEDQFVQYVLANINRDLVAQENYKFVYAEPEWRLEASRCRFLEKYHRVDLLPAQVRYAAAHYPHDWPDGLLEYLLDRAARDPTADERLRRWADRTGGPAAWMYAAYAFYQAGDDKAGEDALKKAVSLPLPDPDWIDDNAPAYELGMAVRFYRSGDFGACTRLCDGILSSRHRYFKTRASVQSVRDWSAATAASRPTHLPAFDEFTSLDPFGGLNLKLLYAAAKPSSASTMPAEK